MFSHLPVTLVSGPFLSMHVLYSHVRRHPEQCENWKDNETHRDIKFIRTICLDHWGLPWEDGWCLEEYH